MIISFAILFGLYLLCMATLILGFWRIPIFSSKVESQITRFSIVIPFRNESENLPALLESLSKLNYSTELFEIIFINDFSEDNSSEIIIKATERTSLPIRLIQNKHISNSPKKDAISEAISTAKFEWILTTDADCEVPINWLKTLDAFIQSEKKLKKIPMMICSPIVYKTNGKILQNFQFFDGLSLQAVTIGSFGLNNPLLCNGANLAYRKDAFEQVKGFIGNNHIASGDDIFLMEIMLKTFPRQVKFLKSREVIVSTKPQNSWRSVIDQRVRWASKTSKQNNASSIFLGILVFLVNLSFLILPFLVFFQVENWIVFLVLFCFKIVIDFVVISQTEQFFKTKNSLWYFGFLPLVYASITILVVLASFRGSYSWKGRRYLKQ